MKRFTTLVALGVFCLPCFAQRLHSSHPYHPPVAPPAQRQVRREPPRPQHPAPTQPIAPKEQRARGRR